MNINPALLSAVVYDPRWALGPFKHLHKLMPKTKGTRCENIMRFVLANRGMRVEPPLNTQHDIIADGEMYEVKSSCVNVASDKKGTPHYSFLQIRPNQQYDFLLLVTLWYDGTLTTYKIPKQDVLTMVKDGKFGEQHGGKGAKSGTYSFNGPIDRIEKYRWFDVKIENEVR